jgi:glyoxylase-like metal-dependent hydrolase (beta-lactamase superfamily II)
MCPIGGRLFPSLIPQKIICHCLLVESPDSLVLIDTGFGIQDYRNPSRLGRTAKILRVTGTEEESARRQIEKLGFSAADVKHIIPTHLDLDHAGGITDFPNATVHVFKSEYDVAQSPKSFLEKDRYRKCHIEDLKWKFYNENYGDDWFGFNAVRSVAGLPPEVLIIPLFGHTKGHTGIAVNISDKWIMHAGDAYYDHNEVYQGGKPLLGWRAFQKIAHDDFNKAMKNQSRLAELVKLKGNEVKVFCAHDPKELLP